MATKQQISEQEQARDTLRAILPPGSYVSTVLRHVSRSGMSRSISVIVNGDDGPDDITWMVARATIQRVDQVNGGIKMGGCGMDMGFALVYQLSRALYPDGFECVGEGDTYGSRCPSNDHSNGDRDYAPHHHHNEGGYALKHRWM